eukprot:4821133-Karenia_brevis.AAC.1
MALGALGNDKTKAPTRASMARFSLGAAAVPSSVLTSVPQAMKDSKPEVLALPQSESRTPKLLASETSMLASE